jgi:hypothetical protein
MKTILIALMVAPAAALATPPDACSLLKLEEINAVAQHGATQAFVLKTGNPAECSFTDEKKAAVLVIKVREVQYAVRDEMGSDRETLEKIYHQKSKPLETIGDGGFWLAANHQLTFRKKKFIASVTFSTPKNQNEVDTAQMARLVESRL